MSTCDAAYMEIALAEALKGEGRTSPNPAVGAILVKEGRVVGRGYHRKAGTPHAEVHALADADEQARGATLYVTLEPCNHTGRTPPCTLAILQAGVSRVVVGMPDPNPRVAGGGSEFLRSQGVEVFSGLLEDQCRALNYPFLKHSATGLPWVIMKAGLSLDGKITFQPRQAGTVTGSESRLFAHQIRNRVDAILIGVETAIIDDPSLTTRLGQGVEARDPLRIVLDSQLRLPTAARLLHQTSTADTWVVCGATASQEKEQQLTATGAKVIRLPLGTDGRIHLPGLLAFLGRQNITSVLVEGGARVHGAFYGQHLVDEIYLFYAPYLIGEAGEPLVRGYQRCHRGEAPLLTRFTSSSLGEDMLLHALVCR